MNLSADEYTRRSIDVASDHEIPSPHFILCNLLQFAFSKKHNDARTSADKLIKIPGIIDELTKAYKETSFAAVQKLVGEQLALARESEPTPKLETDQMIIESREATEKAWNTEYQGLAHERLWQAITESKCDLPYSNTMAIIQSSGMGKSRAVHELGKLVFTLPFNIRASNEDNGVVFPPPDTAVRDMFMDKIQPKLRYHVAGQFLVFFAVLFDIVSKELTKMTAKHGTPSHLKRWHDHLAAAHPDDTQRTVRDVLYNKVVTIAGRTLTDLKKASQNSQPALQETEYFEAATTKAREAAQKLTALLNNEQLVMYFDESHGLFQKKTADIDGNGKMTTTYYDALLAALDALKKYKIFSLFLSTNSGLARYTPTSMMMPSSRVSREALQPPFTELSFDCYPTFPISKEALTMEQVVETQFMCRFGRPLFWARYEQAKPSTKDDIIGFAANKLICAQGVDHLPIELTKPSEELSKRDLVQLAILDVRVLLDFEPRRQLSNTTQQLLIESHMRTVFSVPAHREYIVSGYPSEPILAHAAKGIMATFRKSSSNTDPMAHILAGHIESGLIARGERGEVVARLLLTLAMDKAQEAYAEHVNKPIEDCRAVPLSYFLQALLGADNWSWIKEKRSDNTGGKTFGEAFEFAWVNFSHFGRAGDNFGSTSDAAFPALLRGMAIQCHATQECIDIIIPIFLDNKDRTATLCEERSTGALVSIKNGILLRKVAIDEAKIEFFPPGSALKEKRPYVAIAMELGVHPAAETAKPKENAEAMSVDNPKRQQPTSADKGKKRSHKVQQSTSAARDEAPLSKKLKGPTTPIKEGISVPHKERTSDQIADTFPVHPRYSLSIRGCSPAVYGVVESKEVYAGLLGSCNLFHNHPRSHDDFTNAVKALKPLWLADDACYSWVDKPPCDAVQPVEGVFFGVDEETDPDSEDD